MPKNGRRTHSPSVAECPEMGIVHELQIRTRATRALTFAGLQAFISSRVLRPLRATARLQMIKRTAGRAWFRILRRDTGRQAALACRSERIATRRYMASSLFSLFSALRRYPCSSTVPAKARFCQPKSLPMLQNGSLCNVTADHYPAHSQRHISSRCSYCTAQYP